MGTHRKLRLWTHSGVKIYDSTAAPTSWTNLDFSDIVGKNRALVFLKLKNGKTPHTNMCFFRIPGETEEVGSAGLHAGMCSVGVMDSDKIVHTIMETDVNGTLEWKATNAYDTDIWVLGYFK